jgi:hypothetical protein
LGILFQPDYFLWNNRPIHTLQYFYFLFQTQYLSKHESTFDVHRMCYCKVNILNK